MSGGEPLSVLCWSCCREAVCIERVAGVLGGVETVGVACAVHAPPDALAAVAAFLSAPLFVEVEDEAGTVEVVATRDGETRWLGVPVHYCHGWPMRGAGLCPECERLAAGGLR